MTWRYKLIGLVAALLGVDLRETFREVEHVPYVEHVPVIETEWKDPLEELHELPDEPGRIYCWEFSSDEEAAQFNRLLATEFDKRGRDPNAVHLVITDDEQLRELDPEQFQRTVKPFGGAR
ncbi:MAG: hypothetical protein ACOCUA_02880 [archaeon]